MYGGRNDHDEILFPLTADVFTKESWEPDGELTGCNLLDYSKIISNELETLNQRNGWDGNLMNYFKESDNPSVAEKVVSAIASVETRNGELCGCLSVQLKEELTDQELQDFSEFMIGQYADGWGEMLEQREMNICDESMFVHFWNPMHFSFEVERAESPLTAKTERKDRGDAR